MSWSGFANASRTQFAEERSEPWLTAANSCEVRGVIWAETNLHNRLWTIPARRMKSRKELMVPLSEAALEILRAAQPFRRRTKDSFVFPGKPGNPLSDMTLTKVLRDMGSCPSKWCSSSLA